MFGIYFRFRKPSDEILFSFHQTQVRNAYFEHSDGNWEMYKMVGIYSRFSKPSKEVLFIVHILIES